MTEPSTAIARAPVAHSPAELLPSDDEIRRMYRIAEALWQSGAWKDVKKAEMAFAKMVIGRDLGMTPAQAMQGIHLVEGGIQMHYATLGQFVRSREGYDYRAGWIKEVPTLDVGTLNPQTGELERTVPEQVFVWHDEEDPLDDRPVIGAVVVFTVDGDQRGVSRYTTADALAANLIKDDKRAAWNTSRRNMLLARAMSNGVKWFVPEVMGGLPVYVTEAHELPVKASVTEAVGEGDDEGQGLDLGPKVEAIIERARELGHHGLSNRAAIELAVGNRAPGVINEWVARAREELDRFAAEKAKAEETAVEPGAEAPRATEEQVVPEEEVDAEVVEERSRDPREHVGHRVVLSRDEKGADDVLRCEDCDMTLEAEQTAPDPRDAVREQVESEGGEVQ